MWNFHFDFAGPTVSFVVVISIPLATGLAALVWRNRRRLGRTQSPPDQQ